MLEEEYDLKSVCKHNTGYKDTLFKYWSTGSFLSVALGKKKKVFEEISL